MEKQNKTSFVEPLLHPRTPVESILLIPFWYSNSKNEFIENIQKIQCTTDTPLWTQTANITDEYHFDSTYSNFMKENWYTRKGTKAQITHFSIPAQNIQFLCKSHEFYAFNDKVPKSVPKHADKQLSSLIDLPFSYKIKKIALEVFPYGVACLSIHVEHKNELSISCSLSLLKRLDSQIVLHPFFNESLASTDAISEPKGLLKEYRTQIPDRGFRLGKSNHDAPAIHPISMRDLCYTLVNDKETESSLLYSDTDGLLYSAITTKNKADTNQLNQWLYYLSTANVFPHRPEEEVPLQTPEALEQYDLHTFHKRKGLYIRFCREGVLSLGMVPEKREISYLRTNWKLHWFKKYLLVYKQVLAEEMIVIGFYREARGWFQNEKYRWDYDGSDKEKLKEEKLTSLIDLSERMHRFLMSFRLLDCGHCTDLNAFFDSSRNIMSLDQRIKILQESMAQIVQQISYIEKEKQNEIQENLNRDRLDARERQHKIEVHSNRLIQYIGLVFLPITAVTGWMGMNKNVAWKGLAPEGVNLAPVTAIIFSIILIGFIALYLKHKHFEKQQREKTQ